MSWLLFVGKKVVSAFVYPLGASLLLWLVGIICWRRRPRSYAGPVLVTVGAVWLLVMSMPVTGFFLLHSLEAQAGQYADPTELSRNGVKYIVVLGGDLRAGKLTSADRIAYTSLVRLMEAIRLWKGVPGSRLVLSGGRVSEKMMTTAEGMALLAEELGVPRDEIILEAKSWDTEEEAGLLKPIVGEDRFALVTAARHMPRSIMHFRAKGLDPIPAPADFETAEFIFAFNMLLPTVHGLKMSQNAIHEYLGMCMAMVRQSILR
jgi:uncharacterized SAM-binding protein YcdF (DUF218 family)